MNAATELLNPTFDDVRRLPGRAPDRMGHAYVVEFDSGWVKVGRTTHPRNRIKDHIAGHPLVDHTATRVWVSPSVSDHGAVEQRLKRAAVASCTRRAQREYFLGCPYVDLVKAAAVGIPSFETVVLAHVEPAPRTPRRRTTGHSSRSHSETPAQRLASAVLGSAVLPWIRDRRPHRTWDQIVEDLRDTTRGEIDVSYQTLINWAPDPADLRTQPRGMPATQAEAAS